MAAATRLRAARAPARLLHTYALKATGRGTAARATFGAKHEAKTDTPKRDGGTDTAPQPMEMLLAALVGCEQATAHFCARHMRTPDNGRVRLASIDFAYEAERDARGAASLPLSAAPPAPARLLAVRGTATVHLTSPSDAAGRSSAVAELARLVHARCPVHQTLADAGVTISTRWEAGHARPRGYLTGRPLGPVSMAHAAAGTRPPRRVLAESTAAADGEGDGGAGKGGGEGGAGGPGGGAEATQTRRSARARTPREPVGVSAPAPKAQTPTTTHANGNAVATDAASPYVRRRGARRTPPDHARVEDAEATARAKRILLGEGRDAAPTPAALAVGKSARKKRKAPHATPPPSPAHDPYAPDANANEKARRLFADLDPYWAAVDAEALLEA